MKDKRLVHIEQCLMTHDPVGLIKRGAPLDEYDNEALLIFERTNRYHSVEQVHQTVYHVFIKQFSDLSQKRVLPHLIGPKENYREIAEQIVKILNEYLTLIS